MSARSRADLRPRGGSTQPPPDVSVVIPCRNQANAVAGCVRKAREALASAGLTDEVVVVDDGSTDASREAARAAGAVVVDGPRRGHRGACAAGLAAARGRYLVTLEADGSYDYAELARLVAPLASGRADYVVGAVPPGRGRGLFRRPAAARAGTRAFTRSAYERIRHRDGRDDMAIISARGARSAQSAREAGLRAVVVPASRRSRGTTPRPPEPRETTANPLDNHLGGADAENYRAYELELVAPHCGSHVLEIGSGLGEFAERLGGLPGVERLTVSDTDPMCLTVLADRFAGRDDVDVLPLDLSVPLSVPRRVPSVDTVVLMNVLEHVSDDVGALRRLADLVGPGGRLVIWVPAYEALYGEFDRTVGHVRRYTPTTVRRVAEFAGLTVESAQPVNLLGGLAWWAAVRLGGQRTPDPRWVRAYDRLVVPATRAVERRVQVRFGQSVLCVATVEGAATVGGPAEAGAIPSQGTGASD